jgi:hypothetical protein
MHLSTISTFAFISLTSAALHNSGLCTDTIGGQNVYNSAATIAACNSYKLRNTGSEQWDTCPDCVMVRLPPLKS